MERENSYEALGENKGRINLSNSKERFLSNHQQSSPTSNIYLLSAPPSAVMNP
jgi:hypothetical protein